jgi:hypothetical protein
MGIRQRVFPQPVKHRPSVSSPNRVPAWGETRAKPQVALFLLPTRARTVMVFAACCFPHTVCFSSARPRPRAKTDPSYACSQLSR